MAAAHSGPAPRRWRGTTERRAACASKRAVEKRDVHALALAGALAMQQRGEDALPGHEAADRVEHRRATERGRPVGVAGHGHDAPIACTSMSTPGFSRHGPSGPNGGQRAIDEPGIQRRQPRPVDPEPLGHAAAIGLDHDVGARDQPLEGRAPSGRARSIAALRLLRLTVTSTALSPP